MKYKQRRISELVLSSLKKDSVVLVRGPRQSGKTTLVQHIARNNHPAKYISFDDAAQTRRTLTPLRRIL